MRLLAITVLFTSCLLAQPIGLQEYGSTTQQIVLHYTRPSSSPCTVEASESITLTPPVIDINTSLFPGSNADNRTGSDTQAAPVVDVNKNEVFFVIGTRASQASGGIIYSRSLEVDTLYYVRVTCGSPSATLQIRTQQPKFGTTWRDPFQTNPTAGFIATPYWPTLSWTDRNEKIIEPRTGMALRHVSMPGDMNLLTTFVNYTTCEDLSGGWTNEANCLTGGQVTYSGTTQQWLFLSLGNLSTSSYWVNAPSGMTTPMFPSYFSTQISLQCVSGADCANAAGRTVEMCITFEGQNGTCNSAIQEIEAPTVEACQEISSSLVSGKGACNSVTYTYGDFWGPATQQYRSGFSQQFGSGFLTTSGTSTTVSFTSAADCAKLRIGSIIYYSLFTNGQVATLSCPGSMTVVSAVNLDPTGLGVAGFPFRYDNGFGNNLGVGLLIRKKSTTATSTIGVRNPQYRMGISPTAPGISGGMAQRCSTIATADGFIKCRFGDFFYAVHQVTGVVRHLGTFLSNAGDAGGTLVVGQNCDTTGPHFALWDRSDPNVLWCSASATPGAGGGTRIIKMTMTGGTAANTEVIPTLAQQTVQISRTLQDIAGQSVQAMTLAFDSEYQPTIYAACQAQQFIGNRYLLVQCLRGQQDTYAWLSVYDLGNKLPIGSGGNGLMVAASKSWKAGSKSSWSVMHVQYNPSDTTSMAAFGSKVAQNAYIGNEQMTLAYTERCTAVDGGGNCTTWSATTTPTSGSTLRVRLTSAWSGMPAGCGPVPGTFQSGDPRYIGPDQGQVPEDCWKGKFAVGDQIQFATAGGNEVWQVQTIHGQSASGLDTTVVRDAVPPEDTCTPKQCAVPSATNGFMFAKGQVNSVDTYWDFLQDPNYSNPTFQYDARMPGGGHAVYHDFINMGTDITTYVTPQGVQVDRGVFPLESNPPTITYQRNQPFQFCQGQATGNAYETHPSYEPDTVRVRQMSVDAHPLVSQTSPTVTFISGTLYRLDGITINRKCLATLATNGWFLLTDISGPGSVILDTSADAGKYCVALVNNECVTGSTAGQVFANMPRLNPTNRICSQFAADVDDTCLGNYPGVGMAAVFYEIPALTDPIQAATFLRGRGMLHAFEQWNMGGKGLPNTYNVNMVPGSNWAFASICCRDLAKQVRPDAMLVKIPRWAPVDTVNRGQYIPVEVRIPPVTSPATSAYVQFGYNTLFHCMTRLEACIANAATVGVSNPFSWATETPSGLPCVSGCTISIPAIPGRVVYWRVVELNGGSVITTKPTRVSVVN